MNKKYYIFVDDIRYPKDVTWVDIPLHAYVVVRSFEQFIEYVSNRGYPPSYVCYDHDLSLSHYGDGQDGNEINYSKYVEKTGYDCAKWMVMYCDAHKSKHPPYVVHSMNPVGKENIIKFIESYNKQVA